MVLVPLWMRVAAAGVVSVAAGGIVTTALFVPTLPLRPLSKPAPAPDHNTHSLVQVPLGVGTTTVTLDDGSTVALPIPLAELAADSRVVDVSRVDATTWRVTGSLPESSVAAVSGLSTSSDVLMQASDTNDTYWSLLWALKNSGGSVGGFDAREDADVDGVEANQKSTGIGVVVAVVDSGIQPDHPDLPRLWQNDNEICGNGADDDRNGYVDDCAGWDFLNQDNTPYDRNASNELVSS
ncbi:MAG: hypothetical protein JXA67_16000 [Micromonosporaceae bacterium]|nr:hypothetical protein [Micromonosporaceae bacterium]